MGSHHRAGAGRRGPGHELVDGGLVLLAGALLLTPGFATDVFALVLLFPPTRAPVRQLVLRRLTARATSLRGTNGSGGPGVIDV